MASGSGMKLLAVQRKAMQQQWENEHPELAAKLLQYLSGKLPELDFGSVNQKPGIATRAASSAILAYLAQNIGNMIVSSGRPGQQR